MNFKVKTCCIFLFLQAILLTCTENLSSLTYENILSVEKYQTREWICFIIFTKSFSIISAYYFPYISAEKQGCISRSVGTLCVIKCKIRHFLRVESDHGRKKPVSVQVLEVQVPDRGDEGLQQSCQSVIFTSIGILQFSLSTGRFIEQKRLAIIFYSLLDFFLKI